MVRLSAASRCLPRADGLLLAPRVRKTFTSCMRRASRARVTCAKYSAKRRRCSLACWPDRRGTLLTVGQLAPCPPVLSTARVNQKTLFLGLCMASACFAQNWVIGGGAGFGAYTKATF